MSEMRRLMEAAQTLSESSGMLAHLAKELGRFIGEVNGPEDIEAFTDGDTFAVRVKVTGEEFLYSGDNGEWEFEDAEFQSWPPQVNPAFGTVMSQVT